jgi:Cu(I)/Ag(I) efflux system membrane protein CusA/SilA
MLEKIIEYSIKNRFLIILATVFILLWGIYSLATIPLDAIPDLSDVQVIIYTDYPGQAPQVVEDQITYPLTTSMLAVPGATVVRGYSFFGYSSVSLLFTLYLKMAQTSTGQGAGFLNTSTTSQAVFRRE